MQLRKIAVCLGLDRIKDGFRFLWANCLVAELNGSNNTASDVTNQKAPIGNDQGVVEGGKKVKSAKERMQTQPSPMMSTVRDLFLLNACNWVDRSNMVADERIVEKERVKAEKAKKFAEKQAKLATAQSLTQSSKTSEKKNKAKNEEQLPEYVEETPKGQKKSMYFQELH